MFNNVKEMVDAENDGKTWLTTWRKTPSVGISSGVWFDMSMSPGNPVPNYYAAAPNIAVALKQSTDGGIPHGSNVAPSKKFLKQFTVMGNSGGSSVPTPFMLCDYLLFYPFVDMSTTDEQFMDNTTKLPRSTDGKGVKILPVQVAGALGTGITRFCVTYVNQDGVEGRVTPSTQCNFQTVTGSIISSGPNIARSQGPFLALQPGDTGVRSITSVTFLDADIGLIAFVLVKPVENTMLRTIDAPAERNCFVDMSSMPQIDDDAYLNLLCCPQGSLASQAFHGIIQVIWE